jgi:hypothetical protein
MFGMFAFCDFGFNFFAGRIWGRGLTEKGMVNPSIQLIFFKKDRKRTCRQVDIPEAKYLGLDIEREILSKN